MSRAKEISKRSTATSLAADEQQWLVENYKNDPLARRIGNLVQEAQADPTDKGLAMLVSDAITAMRHERNCNYKSFRSHIAIVPASRLEKLEEIARAIGRAAVAETAEEARMAIEIAANVSATLGD